MKLLHVITALNVGGAETMLAKLLEQSSHIGRGNQEEVLSLMTPGPMAARIRAAGIGVHSLGLDEGQLSPRGFLKLVALARTLRPDAIMGWMHHGHLAATIAAGVVTPRPRLIWNVRHSLSDIRHEKALTRAVLRLCSMLSGQPDAIVYNARASRAQYARFGYRDDRALVLPNGFDCHRYRPSPDARHALLRMFGIDRDCVVIGMVARAHPMKDPETLVNAVQQARELGMDMHLLIAGKGTEALRLVGDQLPRNRVTLAGQRNDVADWLPGLDMLALPSAWGEGFPNILGEAMASGVPCIATDVGDSGWIIGGAGRIVPPRDPGAMAAAIMELAKLGETGRRALGLRGRARVIERFSMPEIAASYARFYDGMMSGDAGVPIGPIPESVAT